MKWSRDFVEHYKDLSCRIFLQNLISYGSQICKLPYGFKFSHFIRQFFLLLPYEKHFSDFIRHISFHTAVQIEDSRFHTAHPLQICRIEFTFPFLYGNSLSDLPYFFGFSIFIRQTADWCVFDPERFFMHVFCILGIPFGNSRKGLLCGRLKPVILQM